jgi:hypothetical protein
MSGSIYCFRHMDTDFTMSIMLLVFTSMMMGGVSFIALTTSLTPS